MVIFNPAIQPPTVRVDLICSFDYLHKVIGAYAVLSGFTYVDVFVSGRFSDADTGETRLCPYPVRVVVGDEKIRIGGKEYEYLAPFMAVLGATDSYVERELVEEFPHKETNQ